MIKHFPVMLQEVMASIPENTRLLLDGTLGHGGHSQNILEKFPCIKVIGIDRDPEIFNSTSSNLSVYKDRFQSFLGSYANIDLFIEEGKLDYILLDIGVNMQHFKDTSRGFSVKGDAILDMRFDTNQSLTAKERINKASFENIKHCFEEYAEFTSTKAQEISEKIIFERKKSSIDTTSHLRKILYDCGLGEKASTVIFQAIRIEVNSELEQLKIFIKKLPSLLKPGGRCGIITFHSVEDRIVKNAFKDLLQNGWTLYTKKAIQPNYKEVQKNKASRSAKFRVIQKSNI